MQTRFWSLVEAWTNAIVGYLISLSIMTLLVEYYFRSGAPVKTALWMTTLFTVTSFLRSYGLRRLFNYISIRQKVKQHG